MLGFDLGVVVFGAFVSALISNVLSDGCICIEIRCDCDNVDSVAVPLGRTKLRCKECGRYGGIVVTN